MDAQVFETEVFNVCERALRDTSIRFFTQKLRNKHVRVTLAIDMSATNELDNPAQIKSMISELLIQLQDSIVSDTSTALEIINREEE